MLPLILDSKQSSIKVGNNNENSWKSASILTASYRSNDRAALVADLATTAVPII